MPKFYCNRTLIFQVIVQNVVTCFFTETQFITQLRFTLFKAVVKQLSYFVIFIIGLNWWWVCLLAVNLILLAKWNDIKHC